MRFRLADDPERISIEPVGMPQASAKNRISVSFAAPSTGGAATRTLMGSAVGSDPFGACRVRLHVDRQHRPTGAVVDKPGAHGDM
jgi:hypothetical protein